MDIELGGRFALGMGMTLASFQSSGIIPLVQQQLKKERRRCLPSVGSLTRSILWILSGPGAVFLVVMALIVSLNSATVKGGSVSDGSLSFWEASIRFL